MKDIYVKLAATFLLLFSGLPNSIAQVFPESFEGTFPPAGWTFFDNGIGTTNAWMTTSTAQSGIQAAYVQYENVTSGIAEDWLVSPLVAITPTSNLLSYWERESFTTDWKSVYKILVSTSSQTNVSTFTTVGTYSENVVNPLTYTNRFVNLSAYTGQNVYIAFKMENDDGDDWFLDNIQLNGGCITPPFAGTISGTTNTSYGNTNQYTVTPYTGNIQWMYGPTPAGPWTSITGATMSPQNITASIGGTMYLTVVASSTAGGCLNDTSNVPLMVNVLFPGDDACGSMSLTVGGPSSTYYQFLGASVQSGEVQPPGGFCTSQQFWCNNTLDNTRWFRFTAPASGHVIIQAPDFDAQLAVWKASGCSGLLSASTATFVCANDDDPDYLMNGGVQFSSYLHAGCLTPGAIYYLQADSYSPATSADSTRIIITDGVTPLDASFTGLNSAYCMPGASTTSLIPAMSGGFFTVNTSTTMVTSFNPVSAGLGTHTVYLTVSGCKSNSVTTVTNGPTLTVASTSSVLCAGQSATLNAGGATSYSWSTGSSLPVALITPSATTTYTVWGTSSGCTSMSTITQVVSACTGINEIASATGMNVYPNPNNGVFTVSADKLPEEIVVSDVLGKKIYVIKPTHHNTLIDLKSIGQGIYFVSVKAEGRTTVIKIVSE